MKTLLYAPLLVVACGSLAFGEPAVLTDAEMDQVAAGVDFPSDDRANPFDLIWDIDDGTTWDVKEFVFELKNGKRPKRPASVWRGTPINQMSITPEN